MSLEAALLIVTVAVAAALLLQTVAVWGIRQSIKAIAGRVETLSAEAQHKLRQLSESTAELVATAKPAIEGFAAVQKQVSATSEIVHRRISSLDAFLEEATDTARLEVARLQDLVDTTSFKFEETVDRLQRGVLAPLTEVSAMLRGIRAGLNFLLRGRKAPAQQSHQDEEMFI